MKKSLIVPCPILMFCFFSELKALCPSLTYKQPPDKFNMLYEEHKVSTEDGAMLNTWYFPSQVKTKVYEVNNPNRLDNFMVDKSAYFDAISKFLAK